MTERSNQVEASSAPTELGSMQDYFEAGASRARSLGNRGPLRFGGGRLDPEIVEAYERSGFYVFESVIDETELAELRADLADLLERAPAGEGLQVDARGRPAAGSGGQPAFAWARPLSDPWGGTSLLKGRHAVKMEEYEAGADAPEKAIFLMLGLFGAMSSTLRLSAHPALLRVAESINGPDFVPYNDSIFLKEPGVGAAVAWHQDGTTHWGEPRWDPGIHGFNFMAQLFRTTPGNGLWVVPGSHLRGHIDIRSLVAANGGSTRLPDAVPMLCEAGDVAICNRQCLHASFANTSPDRRATFVWGFFRRDSVLDVEVDMPTTSAGQSSNRRRYTSESIAERRRLVELAIDARRQHRPDEASYRIAEAEEPERRWSAEERAEALRDYARGTIFI